MAFGAFPVGQHRWAPLWGALVTLIVHAGIAMGLTVMPKRPPEAARALPVEVDITPAKVVEPAPPPSPEPPPPPKPDPAPKLVARRIAVRTPPPMPNQEAKPAPPSDEPVKPVFGVTQDSVVTGESAVAVPVGNTLMTKDRTLAKAPPPPLPPAPPPRPEFDPVDEESVAEFPEAQVKPEPNYPPIAARMGIGGKVRLKLGIDRKGNVKSVRVLEKAGYGMDEEAVRVVWQYRFKPAKRADGQPVDVVITYNFTFRAPNR